MSMTQAWHEDLQEHIRQEDPIDRERRYLAQRLVKAVPGVDCDLLSDGPDDPLRAAVAAVVAAGADYLLQVEQSSPRLADELADALQRLDHQMRKSNPEPMTHQLAKSLELLSPLLAEVSPSAVGRYVNQVVHALQVWMSGQPAGAQLLADAVMALPDVLQPLQPEQQPGGAT